MAARTCVLLGRGLSQGPTDRQPGQSMHQRVTGGVSVLTSWDRQVNLETRASVRGGQGELPLIRWTGGLSRRSASGLRFVLHGRPVAERRVAPA
jgi:hypothetical protein